MTLEAYIKKRGLMTVKQAADAAGLDRSTAQKKLRNLAETGRYSPAKIGGTVIVDAEFVQLLKTDLRKKSP